MRGSCLHSGYELMCSVDILIWQEGKARHAFLDVLDSPSSHWLPF